MKCIPCLLAGAVLVSGCAFNREPLVLDTVGPSRQPLAGGLNGTLVVYSAYDPNPDFNDLPYVSRYTDYTLLSSEGKVLQVVHNNTGGGLLRQPAHLELAPGEYRLIARANGYQTVTVPVVIGRDRVTTVRLDGSAVWPDNAALLESNPVRLPKGEVVGWRASPPVTSQSAIVNPPPVASPAVIVSPSAVVNPPGVVSPSAIAH